MALFEGFFKDKKYVGSINLNEKLLKNMPFAQAVDFASQVDYHQGQVVSKTLSQGPNLSLTLFAFDKNEEISTHASSGDALVQILDGQARITIGDEQFQLKQGEAIVMPANIKHALFAVERFKMFLTVVFKN